MSALRTKLDPENVDKLVYVQENMDRVRIPNWNFKLKEEDCYQPEDGEEEDDEPTGSGQSQSQSSNPPTQSQSHTQTRK